jgi:hypothetical protein
MAEWEIINRGSWGLNNIDVVSDPSRKISNVLRVKYPKGSASPAASKEFEIPIGGAQYYANLNIEPKNELHLRYYVRFADNFDFVKGGKLPGLFGGYMNNGGKIPDGTNGFSTRYMWRKAGAGEAYVYLPSSNEHGTSIGRGSWKFKPGVWYRLEQKVVLNTPGKSDGYIKVWVNGKIVINKRNLLFRITDELKIEGIMFSTFFGGSDYTWGTPEDTYADFANFAKTSFR